MALTFTESLALTQIANGDSSVEPGTPGYGAPTRAEIATYDNYANTEKTIEYNKNYLVFDVFSDTSLSVIDLNKNVSLQSNQLNLTQEKNSQYVPFSLNRKADGYDLYNGVIWIVTNAGTKEDEKGTYAVSPVNVYATEDKIYFGWLIDEWITRKSGQILFEIHVHGQVQGKDNTDIITRGYVWKSKPGTLNVTKSNFNLDDSVESAYNESWVQNIIKAAAENIAFGEVQNQVNNATAAADSAKQEADRAGKEAIKAKNQADAAISIVSNFDSYVDERKQEIPALIESEISSKVQEITWDQEIPAILGYDYEVTTDENGFITDINITVADYVAQELENYYTKNEIDNALQDLNDTFDTTIGELKVVNNDGAELVSTTVAGLIQEVVSNVDVTSQLNKLSQEVSETYATKTEVSNKIGNLGQREDDEGNLVDIETVAEAIANVDVTSQLNELSEEIADTYATKKELQEIDLSSYATKEDLSNIKLDDYVELETYNKFVTDTNGDISNLVAIVDGIDKSPNAKYITTYNEPFVFDGTEYDGKNTLALYEVYGSGETETRSVVSSHVISGGGGGGSTNIITITPYTSTNIAFSVNEPRVINFKLEAATIEGVDLGQCTATWKLNSKTIINKQPLKTGIHAIDFTEYIKAGDDQKLTLIVNDDIGTIKQLNWYVSVVDIKLVSDFADNKTYAANKAINFAYTPYGSVDKTVHFVMDGDTENAVTVTSLKSAAGRQTSYSIPAQSHGSHLFDVYLTAEVNGKTIESNHIIKDFVWYDENETSPVISCSQQKFAAGQYETTKITYSVFDPRSETPEVQLKATYVNADGETVEEYNSSLVMSTSTDYWQYRADIVGEHTLTITCGDTVKTLVATIEKLDIEVDPVDSGLAFDFNPVGHSNNDANKLWSYNSETEGGLVSMSVSDNFDWINGGYQIDAKGDSYFCIKAGTTATIDYKMFCNTYNIKDIGGHYKLVFKTTRVQDASEPFLQCLKNGVGVVMQPQETNMYAGSGNSLYLAYSEEDIIEFELNMGEKINGTPRMVMGYEDGVATKPLIYTDGATFVQGVNDSDAEFITLGSSSCDLHIYRFKAYRRSLSSEEILSNFILDTRNAVEMKDRYKRNQIYKDNVLDPEYLASVCKDLRVIMISAPKFTKDKSEKISDTTVRCIYAGGREVEDNWTVYNCQHSGQGTSSNLYGAAGRNLDLIFNKQNENTASANYKKYPWIEFGNPEEDGYVVGDGSEKSVKVNLTETSVPIDYLNIKVNIASSENANNALLADRYNKFNPYKRPLVREEGYPYIVKDTMEFQNCVIFIRETDETQDADGNYIEHREFNDTDWHFYGIGNIGDSKKTDSTRMNDPNDVNEFVIEVMDNNLPNSKFQSGVEDEQGYSITGPDIKREWQTYKDNTFVPKNGDKYIPVTAETYLVQENLPIFYELIDGEYISTIDTEIIPGKTYYEINYPNEAYAGLYVDKYAYNAKKGKVELERGWGISFECRYEHKKGDHEEHRRLWNEFYEFVIFSTDDEFKSKLEDYCVLDSVAFYYLFTLRYTMIDNRAKNCFWHYGKCADGQYRWDLTMDYDNDTALGIDNLGKQVYRYGYEDIDYVDIELQDENAPRTWVFNAATSTIFRRLRNLFGAKLDTVYNDLDSSGSCWSAEDLIAQWDNAQSQFPEELWRLDIERKYIRPYSGSGINGAADQSFLKEKLNGRKKYHRRQFERNQEKYMASKFRTTGATQSNIIRMRAKKPTGALAVPADFDITLTPYAYMYVSVDYANGRVILSERAKPGVPVKLDYPLDNGDIIVIESAGNLQSVGDLSPLYIEEGTFTAAARLKELILGNNTPGYANTALASINIVEDGLLEYINIENIPSLDDELNMSSLRNMKTIKAKGSGIQGLVLAQNGAVETLSLPGSLGILSMKNLSHLKDIDIDSLDNLTRLIIENCDFSTINNFVIGNNSYPQESVVIKDKVYYTPNEITLLNNAPHLQRVRLTGINWNLPNVDLLEYLYSPTIGGYDANGKEITRSVLAGHVYVSEIKESEYNKYKELWPALEITYTGWTSQYKVIFETWDGQIFDEQNVDYLGNPTDPVKRLLNQKEPPVKPSTTSTNFTFKGWARTSEPEVIIDVTKEVVREAIRFVPVFEESVRKYVIRYIMNIEQERELASYTAEYGTVVEYTGEIPTYTTQEALSERFYLFTGWDKSGYVDGNKTITAQFDEFQYKTNIFKGIELSEMSPVQVYALTRMVELGKLTYNGYDQINETEVSTGDSFSFVMGHDLDYADIESYTIIKDPIVFNGDKCIELDGTVPIYQQDSNGSWVEHYQPVRLFDQDKDFVLALDYKMSSSNASSRDSAPTIMQCFSQAIDVDGFKLSFDKNKKKPLLAWGDASSQEISAQDRREMVILRHKKGENSLHVYSSNLDALQVGVVELKKDTPTLTSEGTNLVLGGSKESYGFANKCYGEINWCKVWYTDLGEQTCKKLAGWPREKIELNVSGFYRYVLSNGSGTRSTISFLASHLLDITKKYYETGNDLNTNGGWADSSLEKFLNERLYPAIPDTIKPLLKNVAVKSTVGSKSSKISSKGCYIAIPALYDLVDYEELSTEFFSRDYAAIYQKEVDDTHGTISFMTDATARRRAFSNGDFATYWTRSPNLGNNYYWYIQPDGTFNGYAGANTTGGYGVLIEISI